MGVGMILQYEIIWNLLIFEYICIVEADIN